jgi:hypothetical protein
MSKSDDFLDRIFWAVVTRISGRTVAALALLFYVGGGLALPLALGWSMLGLVVANIIGTTYAGLVILGWLALQVEAARRRHLLEWTTDLRHLTGEEGEWLLRELFEREGWTVQHTGSQERPDGNIDLDMIREGQRAIVQCKFWQRNRVGVRQVREFGGTLLREGLKGSDGIFVTIADIREDARAEAKKIGMTLFDKTDLHSRIEKVRRPESCPICQKPMRLDHSSQGWWFHCVSGCPGKRDLGRDPGRVVDLLTQPPVA